MQNKVIKILNMLFLLIMFSIIFIKIDIKAAISKEITLFVGESWSVEMSNSDNYIGTVNGTKKGNKYEKEYATATISGKKLTIKATKGNGNYNTFYVYKKNGTLARTVKVNVRTKPSISSITNTTSTKTKSANIYLYTGGNASKAKVNYIGAKDSILWTFSKTSGSNVNGITLADSTSNEVTIKSVVAGTYTLTAKVSAKSTQSTQTASKSITVYVYTIPSLNVLQNDVPVSSLTLSKGATQNLTLQKVNLGIGVKDTVTISVPTQYSSYIATTGINSTTGFFSVSTKPAFPKGATASFTVNWTINSGDNVSNNNGAQTIIKSISVKLSDLTIIQKLNFEQSSYVYHVGDKKRVYPMIMPANTKVNENFIWSSSNKNVASVDSNGNVICNSIGTTTITVQATDGSGAKASYKAIVGAPNPIELKTSASSKGIKVSWNTIVGVSKYEVYRSTQLNGMYKSLAKVSSLSYTDTDINANKTYYYKIIAIADAGSTYNSGYSDVVAGKFTLLAPTELKTSKSSKGIKVSWNQATGASKYEVYRSTKSNGTYTSLGKITETSYTDRNVIPKKTYYYKIVSISNSNAAFRSGYSHALKGAFALSTPTVKTIKKSSSAYKVTISGTKYSGFIIYYGKSKKTKILRAFVKGKTASLDIPAKSKKKKIYVRVRAYKKIGNKYYYSEYSTAKKMKV